jgi:hypothetical protein
VSSCAEFLAGAGVDSEPAAERRRDRTRPDGLGDAVVDDNTTRLPDCLFSAVSGGRSRSRLAQAWR